MPPHALPVTTRPRLPPSAKWTFDFEAEDPDGDAVTVELVSAFDADGTDLTGQMVLDAADGRLTVRWTPAAGDDSTRPVRLANLVVRATDPAGAGEQQNIQLPILTNVAPFILAVNGSGGVERGAGLATWTFDFLDANADDVIVEVVAAPAGVASPAERVTDVSVDPADPSSAVVTFAPDADLPVGEYELLVRLADTAGASAQHAIPFVVHNGNQQPPQATLRARAAVALGETFVAQVEAWDPNGDPLVYALEPGHPVGMEVDPQSGRITWTPSEGDVTPDGGSPYEYTVTVTDGNTPPVAVGPVPLAVVTRWHNHAPQILDGIAEERASDDQPLVYQFEAEDLDNDPLAWVLLDAPATASIDPLTGRFTWRPAQDEFGVDQPVTVQVADPYGGLDQETFILRATESYTPGNAAPRIVSDPPQPGEAGSDYTYVVRAEEPDGERVIFSLQGEAAGRSDVTLVPLDDTSALLTWSAAPSGTFDFRVLATDERGLSGWQDVTVTFPPAGSTGGDGTQDTAPSITSEPTFAVMLDDTYSYQVVAEDPDGLITYAAEVWTYDPSAADGRGSAVRWLSIDGSDGLLTGIASDGDVATGTYVIRVTASQGGGYAWQEYRLAVVDPAVANTPPGIQPETNLTAAIGEAFELQVRGYDPDGDDITYKLKTSDDTFVDEWAGMSIDAKGRVTWTPEATDGDRIFVVRVTDEHGAWDEEGFDIVVTGGAGSGDDAAPSVSLWASNASPQPGEVVEFAVSASDDDAVVDLRLRLNAPWLDAAGLLVPVDGSGRAAYRIPDSAQTGQTLTAVATAYDTANQSTSTSPIGFVVTPVDTAAPVIRLDNIVAGMRLEEALTVRGAAFDPDDQLAYLRIVADLGGSERVLLERGESGGPRIDGVGDAGSAGDLVTLQPLDLPDGQVQVGVYAEDVAGNAAFTSFAAEVDTQSKVGNFGLGFVDLETAVGGLPVSVSRSYDSLNAGEDGDFGYGWELGIERGELRVGVPDGGDPLFGDQGFEAAYEFGTRITVTLPDGSERGFTTELLPYLGDYGTSLPFVYMIAFLPDVDSRDTRLELEYGYDAPLYAADLMDLPPYLGLPPVLQGDGSIGSFQVRVGERHQPAADDGRPALQPSDVRLRLQGHAGRRQQPHLRVRRRRAAPHERRPRQPDELRIGRRRRPQLRPRRHPHGRGPARARRRRPRVAGGLGRSGRSDERRHPVRLRPSDGRLDPRHRPRRRRHRVRL